MSEGKVLALYISTGNPQNPRKSVESLEVDENGIIGDKFYAKNENRAILVASQSSYDLVKDKGIEIKPGVLGENIFIDINPYSLSAGDIIQIGEIKLQVTQNCTLCKGLTTIHPKLPKLLKDDRGIFTKALTSGTISLHDSVKLIKKGNA